MDRSATTACSGFLRRAKRPSVAVAQCVTPHVRDSQQEAGWAQRAGNGVSGRLPHGQAYRRARAAAGRWRAHTAHDPDVVCGNSLDRDRSRAATNKGAHVSVILGARLTICTHGDPRVDYWR